MRRWASSVGSEPLTSRTETTKLTGTVLVAVILTETGMRSPFAWRASVA